MRLHYLLKISTIFVIVIFLLLTVSSITFAKASGKTIFINSFERSVPQSPDVATRTIMSESNIPFTIPYIQTSNDMHASVGISKLSRIQKVKLVLSENGHTVADATLTYPYKTTFYNLDKGEYTLDAYALNTQSNIYGGNQFHDQVTNIGIGDIIVAIGDSTTEGTFLYKSQFPTWLTAPTNYLSFDNRTYPQPGGKATFPTQTWMPELSNELEKIYGYPVFIKNAGYSSFATTDYLSVMKTKAWANRQHAIAPNKWIILLGVNDGIKNVPEKTYESNLQGMITILEKDYHAEPKNIMLAKPTYAIGHDHVHDLLPAIDALWLSDGVAHGPDFWTFFSTRFYPTFAYYKDQYHQTPSGMREMVQLWTISYVNQESLPIKLSFYIPLYTEQFFAKVERKLGKLVNQVGI